MSCDSLPLPTLSLRSRTLSRPRTRALRRPRTRRIRSRNPLTPAPCPEILLRSPLPVCLSLPSPLSLKREVILSATVAVVAAVAPPNPLACTLDPIRPSLRLVRPTRLLPRCPVVLTCRSLVPRPLTTKLPCLRRLPLAIVPDRLCLTSRTLDVRARTRTTLLLPSPWSPFALRPT